MINVFSERTMLLEKFGGVSLNAGEQSHAEGIEKAFVDAGFAEYITAKTKSKMANTPENKMHKTDEDKSSNKDPSKASKRIKDKKSKG